MAPESDDEKELVVVPQNPEAGDEEMEKNREPSEEAPSEEKPNDEKARDQGVKERKSNNTKFRKREPAKYSSTGDIVFAFAPEQGYAQSIRGQGFSIRHLTTGWYFSSFSAEEESTFYRAYTWAFSPHGDEYIIFPNEKNKSVSCIFRSSGNTQAPSYQSLKTWLHANVSATEDSALETLVVFGSGASYYAVSGNKCTWHDLPERLDNQLNARKAKYESRKSDSNTDVDTQSDSQSVRPPWIPRILALGAQATFFAAWEDNTCDWSLTSSSFRTYMEQSSTKAKDLVNVILSPVDVRHYVSVEKDGFVRLSWDSRMTRTPHDRVSVYMQMRAKEDGTTFNFSYTEGNTSVSIHISSETNFGSAKLSVPKSKYSEVNRSWPKTLILFCCYLVVIRWQRESTLGLLLFTGVFSMAYNNYVRSGSILG